MPVQRIDGTEIYWESVGSGDPVLLIQGLGANRLFWKPLLPSFADHAKVILFDWPGTGESGDVPSDKELSTELIAGLAGRLLEELDIPAAHIVGRSMGGCIAQHMAMRYPDRTKSLTLASTWAKADGFLAELLGSWPDLLTSGGDALLLNQATFWAFPREFFERPAAREHSEVEDVISEAITLEQRPTEFRRLADAGIAHDTTGQLYRIDAPTLVMVGREDILTPLSLAKELYRSIPRARLQVVEGAGHGFYEQMPLKFTEAVLAFWESLRTNPTIVG